MRQCLYAVVMMGLIAGSAGCARSVNVEAERTAVLAADRDWSQSVTDIDKFVSFFTSDATAYPQGMPALKGADAIRATFTEMMKAPGFSLAWTAERAEVAGSGDVAYTTGTYEMSMGGGKDKGKYVTVWRKQADGSWKAVEDIFNSDLPAQGPPAEHVMMAPGVVKWQAGPPSLPPGAQFAVVAGDPTQAQPFVIRAQVPAGYRVPPHWHPTTENLTVLSGTVALGMGDQFDDAQMTTLAVGGFAALPAEMHHYFLARTASTFQVHGMGPFAVNYVNPADDPSKGSR